MEGGRDGEKQGGREGGREGWREAGSEGGREGGKKYNYHRNRTMTVCLQNEIEQFGKGAAG